MTIKKDIKPVAVDTGRRVIIENPLQPKVVRTRLFKKEADISEPVVKDVEHEETTAKDLLLSSPSIQNHEPLVQEKKIPLYVEPLEFDESGDFAAMLQASEADDRQLLCKIGDKVSGKVIHIGKEHVFVSLGSKIEAAIAVKELMDTEGNLTVRMGQKLSAYVVSTHSGITLSNNIADPGVDTAVLVEACAKKIPVSGKVLALNKGGFDIQVSDKRAFCPIGQIDNKFVEDAQSYVGKVLDFLIERIEEGGRNIVLSRKALIVQKRRDQALETIQDLEVNKKYSALITRVADFGAFADIGGLEGLIPRSEISHGHIDKVTDAVSSGDKVEVLVLSFEINQSDPIKSKLVFSLKKVQEDPYLLHWNKIKEGLTLEGRVVRVENFGAFVELFPGIDGLIHISQLSENRVAHPREILSIHDPVTVRVISVDDEEKRIGLSLRELVTRKKDNDASHIKLERGQKIAGVVSRIERYGVFLELSNGSVGLLPQSEINLPKTADLHRAFEIGDTINVVVIDVDAHNRIRVSALAYQQMEERDSYLQFQADQSRSSSFGTFADLLKKRN